MGPIWGGSNNANTVYIYTYAIYIYMVVLRDFPYHSALFGLVSYNDPLLDSG